MKNYNKSLSYRRNHELDCELFEMKGVWPFHLIGSLTAIPFLLGINYSALKASDFAFLVLFLLYYSFIRPRIYRGDISAYYRRKYSKRLLSAVTWFVSLEVFAVWRLLTITLFRGIKYKDYLFIVRDVYHPIATNITILIALFLFYLTFYQDKYTTIKEYSNGINYNIKELGMNPREALNEFLRIKDEEYGVQEFWGMYYDHPEIDSKEKSISTNEVEDNDEDYLIRRNPREKVRR